MTATKTDLIGYALVGYAVNQDKFSYVASHYITDVYLDNSTGEVTVTRTGAGVYSGAKFWVYAVKVPS